MHNNGRWTRRFEKETIIYLFVVVFVAASVECFSRISLWPKGYFASEALPRAAHSFTAKGERFNIRTIAGCTQTMAWNKQNGKLFQNSAPFVIFVA